MVELTNIAGKKIFINLNLVRLIEASPDTILVFVDGQKLLVREAPQQIAALYNQLPKNTLSLEEASWTSQQ